MVRTGTRTPEEVDIAKEALASRSRGDCHNNHGNKLIAKYAFEGKMKDGPISKLIITKTGHRPTQFKKITDALPILCADKNFQGLDVVFWTGRDLVETDFMPTYLNAN